MFNKNPPPPKKKKITTTAKGSRNKSTMPSTVNTILEINEKLYHRFEVQADENNMSLAKYAKKLGLTLKEIKRIKTEKCIQFVPKLKAALLEDHKTKD
ncbi:MAG: hypothetical protein HQM14_11830 [SAR324 cluster bacterium]|nr:hypothetical protein [SAR324 cluster bacterium]